MTGAFLARHPLAGPLSCLPPPGKGDAEKVQGRTLPPMSCSHWCLLPLNTETGFLSVWNHLGPIPNLTSDPVNQRLLERGPESSILSKSPADPNSHCKLGTSALSSYLVSLSIAYWIQIQQTLIEFQLLSRLCVRHLSHNCQQN